MKERIKLDFSDFLNRKEKICIVGLGYVGLPLAVAFSKKFDVIGYDKDKQRIDELKRFIDKTNEVYSDEIKRSNIFFTNNEKDISKSRIIIIAVPTPINIYKDPDLQPLNSATTTVARNIKKGSVIVYESTVYPGLTEEVCVPLIESVSGFKWKKDFFVGYSPERVNPGDKNHTIEKIKKIVSGDTPYTVDLLSKIYGSIIDAGIHKASSIKVAEAAKVIENTQRDINIAFINELSILFSKLGINTKEVLDAASTKWNFLRFEPGLVGGHCIGVDPYYLAYKAREIGYHPEILLAGRRINDSMGSYVANLTLKTLSEAGIKINSANILILGLSFKENIPDIRNSKVKDIYDDLKKWGVNVYVVDPYADKKDALKEYGIKLSDIKKNFLYDAVILAVKHRVFVEMGEEKMINMIRKNGVFFDVKSVFSSEKFIKASIRYLSL